MTRQIIQKPLYGGKDCFGALSTKKPCNNMPCPVDCKLSSFTQGPCNKSCGGGYVMLTRTIIQEPTYGGKQCFGPLTKNETCNTQPCPGRTKKDLCRIVPHFSFTNLTKYFGF